MGTWFFFAPRICPHRLKLALTLFHWRALMEHEAPHFTSGEKSLLMILYVFSVLFITTLTAGVKRETSRKNLPRLPSGKVELKLERGITWTKAPRGREWEWKRKRKERKGDRGSVMGCCCSVLGMIKQWGWIRALSYDKHMHTQTHRCAHTHSHTTVSASESTCLSMDGVDCTALTHPRLHVEPRGASDWHGDTNGVEQESCWEWQISGCGDAAEVYVGSGSRPSALSFDLQRGTAFDVLIISLNRAQGGWGEKSRGEGRGE